MKVIPVTEAKARLTHYGQRCRKEQIAVTVSGRPAFKFVAIDVVDLSLDAPSQHYSSSSSHLLLAGDYR